VHKRIVHKSVVNGDGCCLQERFNQLHACTDARTQECTDMQELELELVVRELVVITTPSTVPSLLWAAQLHMGTHARYERFVVP
jgi:hypothetical protein